MKVIIISGTPGTGKSTLAKKLAKEKHYKYIDANECVKKEKLYDSYDKTFKTYDVDIAKFKSYFEKLIKSSKENIIIDSHLSHYISPKLVSSCIITKTSIPKLRLRLKKRKYSLKKIQENVDSENFDICYNEAVELGHKVKVVIT